jgi:hypothetical protein
MTTPPTPSIAPAGRRLPNGELRRRVAGFLASRAGSEFTPGEVARGLPGGPRSSGAVGNALSLLADPAHSPHRGDAIGHHSHSRDVRPDRTIQLGWHRGGVRSGGKA